MQIFSCLVVSGAYFVSNTQSSLFLSCSPSLQCHVSVIPNACRHTLHYRTVTRFACRIPFLRFLLVPITPVVLVYSCSQLSMLNGKENLPSYRAWSYENFVFCEGMLYLLSFHITNDWGFVASSCQNENIESTTHHRN